MRSFHPDWNPEMAVHVLARLRQTVPDATLVMAGQDKGLQAPTVDLARKLGLDRAVRFPGFLNMPAKIREGEAADIFVNTNHVDNMPVALVEAGAMGLPVVSTAVGGVPDLITHGESGLLVPDNDARAMAEAICLLLKDPELAAKLSAGGRQVAERSAWEHVLPLWERVFCEVISQSGRAMENL
jgi:glycosyltransferase involved in cell wall biosynthesis